jgi:hypothetical protein
VAVPLDARPVIRNLRSHPTGRAHGSGGPAGRARRRVADYRWGGSWSSRSSWRTWSSAPPGGTPPGERPAGELRKGDMDDEDMMAVAGGSSRTEI